MAFRSWWPKTSPYPRVNWGGALALPLNWLTICTSVTSISPISTAKPSSSGTISTATAP